jgi:uncharacterized protein (DUF1810 family)
MSGDPFDLPRFVAAQAHPIHRTVREIFGSPDDLKFHSSMTLFECARHQAAPFGTALNIYFNGKGDEATLRGLGG